MAKEDGAPGYTNGGSNIFRPDDGNDDGNGDEMGKVVGGYALKALALFGGAYVLRKLTKKVTSRGDHTRKVAEAFCGEKFSADQVEKDPFQYFNIRLNTCPAGVLSDGSQILYSEQAFWRTPEKPYRQRFVKIKPCSKDTDCDVELSSYSVKDVDVFRNFCDRKVEERPSMAEVEENLSEHLSTVNLKQCGRGRKCIYQGATPPGGFPQNYNGASYSTCDVTLFKSGEMHQWDRGFNAEGAQVFGPTLGAYEFKPKHLVATRSSLSDTLLSRALDTQGEESQLDPAT